MAKRKILFTDLDGTLLNKESKVAGEMQEALMDMCKAGHVLVLSSGRPLKSILGVMEEAGLNCPGMYVIANNGTLIYDCDKKENLLELRVPFEDVKAIWEIADKRGIHVQTYTDTHIISVNEDKELEYYRRKIHLPYIVTKEPFRVLEKEPYKVLCIGLDNRQELEEFQEEIQKKLDGRIQSVFSNPYYLEMFVTQAGKGNALKYLCKQLQIPIENSIAAGDAQNDISMLEAAGLAVAMCNGDEDIKQVADVITKRSNQECGLADVIREYILK